MKTYHEMSSKELAQELSAQQERFAAYKQRGLKLNMARGKPSPEQLDLSLPLLDLIPSEGSSEVLQVGTADDLRNYGNLTGLPEARELMGALMDVPAANVLIGGNSSLNLMYNMVSMAMTHGVLGSTPWAQLDKPPVFLCPVPGYDRHFSVTEHFGIRMVLVPMTETGPNMDMVEELVNSDPLIKGIWCVPRFSNPTGCVYSDETVLRFASLTPAAEDFRIYWDNAYAVHDLGQAPPPQQLLNLKDACEKASNSNIWYQFSSTSKITFAGSGLAALSSSEENLGSITKALSFQTIGPDKINQKRHTLFLPNLQAVHKHMAKHAALLASKFDIVGRVLARGLAGTGIGEWTIPQGGYFISFEGPPNTAQRTIELAAETGVVLTPAGATYPYGKDPLDSNIRIAPSYPGLEELELACEVLVTCVRIATLEQLS
ncbi:MAG: aminotransferase [Coriobacteriia bacterium]|nr:aminotransferase [Coriobacteriia bacterium]MCL2750822.1 aminotransferase [Coriobacteriia bacterium]